MHGGYRSWRVLYEQRVYVIQILQPDNATDNKIDLTTLPRSSSLFQWT